MNPVEVHQGGSPLILSMPHSGTYLPEDIHTALNDTGCQLADTDWYIHTLYKGLLSNVTTVRATFHRYALDANRPPSDESLYPGQNTTGLCPLIDFQGSAIYRDQCQPSELDIQGRRESFHKPYHQALKEEIDRVRKLHGIVVLYDCHSIRSQLPYLFEGVLPDFNIGSNDGRSCSPEIEKIVAQHCQAAQDYTSVVNGRFKGGWTTRFYGQPGKNIHAIQMELVQSTYMEETSPWNFLPEKAQQVRVHLKNILQALEEFALSNSAGHHRE